MFPIIAQFGFVTISTFGLFLAISLLTFLFVLWRLSRYYDEDSEKLIDLAFIVVVCGLIGARLNFIILNFDQFGYDILKMIYILRIPGLEFPGGLVGAIIGILLFAKRFKLEFWKVADYMAVALCGAIIIGLWGCQLSGCVVGLPTNMFYGVELAGVIGKRIPISFFESIPLIFIYLSLWKISLKYHFPGKVSLLFLIELSIVRFIASFWQEGLHIGILTIDQYLAIFAFLVSSVGLYRLSKRNFKEDLIGIITTMFNTGKCGISISGYIYLITFSR